MRDICQMIDLYRVISCLSYLFYFRTTLFFPLYLTKLLILLILFFLLTGRFTILIVSFLSNFMPTSFILPSLTLLHFLTMVIHSRSLLKVLPLYHSLNEYPLPFPLLSFKSFLFDSWTVIRAISMTVNVKMILKGGITFRLTLHLLNNSYFHPNPLLSAILVL